MTDRSVVEVPDPRPCSQTIVSPGAEPCGDYCENCIRNARDEYAFQLKNCRRIRDGLLDRLEAVEVDRAVAAKALQRFACGRWKGTFNGGWTPDGTGDGFWQALLVAALEAAGFEVEGDCKSSVNMSSEGPS